MLEFDEIESIEYIGEHEVYDVEIKEKEHNFFANNILVHNCHASNKTMKEANNLFDGYPMNRCMQSREVDPSCWLKMRFIRPEDVHLYTKIGINNFKITGRTGTTEYILKVGEAYCKRKWNGNLLSLWKQLETIYTDENELEYEQPTYIENEKLDGFVQMWFKNENHECSNENCGVTCNYCNVFYNRKIRNEKKLEMDKLKLIKTTN